MASPVDANRIATNIAVAADPWTVNLPAGITAGQLLIAFLRTATTPTVVTFSGWTQLLVDSGDPTDDNSYVYYRWADGSESATVSVDMSAAVKGAAIAWRITGAANPATQPPSAGGIFNFGTVANSADPSAFSPPGGSKDYLFLLAVGCDGEGITFAHGTYVNDTNANSGTAGAVATNCCIGGASLQKTTALEDPAAFTHAAASTGGAVYKIAIHPGVFVPTTYERQVALLSG